MVVVVVMIVVVVVVVGIVMVMVVVMVQPDLLLQVGVGRKSTNGMGADRFIPNRSTTDMEHSMHSMLLR